MTTTSNNPEEATQRDVVELYSEYGGSLNAKQDSQLNFFLAAMHGEEQRVNEVKGEMSDALYHAGLKLIRMLQGRAAGATQTARPNTPKPSQRQRVTATKQDREKWREMMRKIRDK